MTLRLADTPDAEQEAIECIASRWVVRASEQPLSLKDQTALKDWIAADDRHRDVFLRLVRHQQTLAHISQLSSAHNPGLPPPKVGQRLLQLIGATLLKSGLRLSPIFVVILAVFILWPKEDGADWQGHFQSAEGPAQHIDLPDRSTLTLAPSTDIVIHYTKVNRHLKLIKGQAYFDVAHDPKRPFWVDSGGRRIKALGTAFSVYHDPIKQLVDVTLAEGHLALGSPDDSDQVKAHLSPGQQAYWTHDAFKISKLSALQLQQNLAWRKDQLMLQGETLAEALMLIARYHNTYIDVPDESLLSQRLTGYFSLRDSRALVTSLAQALHLQVEVLDSGYRLTPEPDSTSPHPITP